MLIQFKVANFRSFREEQVLSLVASKDAVHEKNLTTGNGTRLLKAAAIYGANASGKSNLIKAMRCMQNLVANSATQTNLGDKLPGISPFRLDNESRGNPSTFEIALNIDGIHYEYGFAATEERVWDEWLHAYPQQKKQRWLTRRFSSATGKTSWDFKQCLKPAASILSDRTRENVLALSRGVDMNISELYPLFLAIKEGLRILDLSHPKTLTGQVLRTFSEDKVLSGRVAALLREADTGIADVVVRQDIVNLDTLPEPMRENLPKEVLDAIVSGKAQTWELASLHQNHESGHIEQFDFQEDESNGTQRFLATATLALDALDKGTTVILDELDCSMHPLLTRKIVELFQSPFLNKKGAQLVFTTHDTTMMDPRLFRRDQIFLFEKNQSGASRVFSLYDFGKNRERPRNTEAFEKNYLAGRYGGVPDLGPVFEELRFK